MFAAKLSVANDGSITYSQQSSGIGSHAVVSGQSKELTDLFP